MRVRSVFDGRLSRLKSGLAAPDSWNQRVVRGLREGRFDRPVLRRFFVQYARYVRRFTNWLGYVVANAELEEVQSLLVPNLVDELRDPVHGVSHRELLLRLMEAMGIERTAIEQATDRDETAKGFAFFDVLYKSSATVDSLFAFGPGTEAVSWCFLEPMREAARAEFGLSGDQLAYFDVHDPSLEAAHVGAVDQAIYAELARQPEERREEQFTLGCRKAEEAAFAHRDFFDMVP